MGASAVLELWPWLEDEDVVHQLTTRLQWIHPQWVLEDGMARDIYNGN